MVTLQEGEIYLSSWNTGTWEPCRLMKDLGSHVTVKFMTDGVEKTFPSIILDEPTLKPITEVWANGELATIVAGRKLLENRQSVLMQVFDQLRGAVSNQSHR